MWKREMTLEEIRKPDGDSVQRAHRDRAAKNWDWLQAHWSELLPQAYGKYLAVANQDAFIADTLEVALAWVRETHPGDTGHIIEYIMPPTGPRIYSGQTC